jgi:hypothetical protein
MSRIILRGRWCHIIALNVHAPTEDKTDNMKDSFYEIAHEILLRDFNARVGWEDNFKPTNRNESLLEISNDNGIRFRSRKPRIRP